MFFPGLLIEAFKSETVSGTPCQAANKLSMREGIRENATLAHNSAQKGKLTALGLVA